MTMMSREYAEALFELAAEEKQIGETTEGLALVKAAMKAEPAWQAMLASPAIGKEIRLAALDEAFRGRIPEILLGVLRMMTARGHVSELTDMAREFEELAREYRGEAEALVTSAVALSEEEQEKLKAGLEKKFRRQVTLRCEVDPALIGGVRVEMEGSVIDGSLKNRLDQIKEVMHQ